jgi:hypothetical protein
MTKQDKLIISAYTGVLMVNQNEFHQFAEKILKRPVQEYEFLTRFIWETLKRKTKDNFISPARTVLLLPFLRYRHYFFSS